MAGKSQSRPLFSNTEWWKEPSPIKASANPAGNDHDNSTGNIDVMNYGAIPSSYESLYDDEDDVLINGCGDEYDGDQSNGEFGKRSCNKSAIGNGTNGILKDQSSNGIEFGKKINLNYNAGNNNGSDDDDDNGSSGSDEELEPPHKTCGLIFFDFVRFIAIMANFRNIGTQMVPVFLAVKTMKILHVALRWVLHNVCSFFFSVCL